MTDRPQAQADLLLFHAFAPSIQLNKPLQDPASTGGSNETNGSVLQPFALQEELEQATITRRTC